MIETKKVGDICSSVFAGGTPNTKHEEYYDGDIPWIRSGEIDFNIIRKAERNITEEGYNNSSAKKIPTKSVVMAMTGATVAKTAIVEIDTTANQSVCAMVPNSDILNYRYLYYYFCKNYYVIKASAQGALTSLNLAMIKNLEIPLPPLPIQEEIVSVLDKFSELIEKTDEEIALRQKQYEYYREKLLTFEEKSYQKIGNITKVFSASRVHKNEWQSSGVPFWRSSDVMSFYKGEENSRGKAYISYELYEKLSSKSGKIHKDDLLVTGGGSIGIPYIVPNDEPLYVKDADLLCIVKNDTLNTKFLFYFMLSNEFRAYLKKITHDASIPHYTISQIKETPVPLPPLSRQQEIVATLDKFEAMISNLKEERELRQKQYEYYREKLLTF